MRVPRGRPRGRGGGVGVTRGRSISQPRRGARGSRSVQGRRAGLVQLQVELFENGATDNALPQLGDRGQAAAGQALPGEVTMLADHLTGVSITSDGDDDDWHWEAEPGLTHDDAVDEVDHGDEGGGGDSERVTDEGEEEQATNRLPTEYGDLSDIINAEVPGPRQPELPAGSQGWESIDRVGAYQCHLSLFSVLEDCPYQYRSSCAWV